MNEAFIVALLVAMTTIVSPVVLALVSYLLRRKEKDEDITRQERREEKADKVAEQAEEAAKLLLAANERVAKASDQTHDKLDEIHTLVNSTLTEAMQDQLDTTIANVALLKQIIARDERDGIEVDKAAKDALASGESKIDELHSKLTDRKKAQDTVDAQQQSKATASA